MGKGGTARTDALPPASSPAPAAAKPHRRPAAAAAAPVHAMAGIVGKRIRKGNPEFLVRWVGFGADADTWEPMRHLMDGGLGAVKDYERLVALDKKQLLELALEQQLKTQAARWTASKKPKKQTAATAQAEAGRVKNGDTFLLCEDCPRPNAAWWAPPPDGFHVNAKRCAPVCLPLDPRHLAGPARSTAARGFQAAEIAEIAVCVARSEHEGRGRQTAAVVPRLCADWPSAGGGHPVLLKRIMRGLHGEQGHPRSARSHRPAV